MLFLPMTAFEFAHIGWFQHFQYCIAFCQFAGELFALCPVESYPCAAVEQVLDSSRYFVLRIQDVSGKEERNFTVDLWIIQVLDELGFSLRDKSMQQKLQCDLVAVQYNSCSLWLGDPACLIGLREKFWIFQHCAIIEDITVRISLWNLQLACLLLFENS